ncbi:MAG: hypothetical protein QM736_11355 [Vicinamibacterales bacterium]
MPRSPLAQDTSPDVEELQIDAWRRMTPDEKANMMTGITQAVFDMALAGLASRHPEASDYELWLRRAVLVHGRDLAMRAYPDIARLGLTFD